MVPVEITRDPPRLSRVIAVVVGLLVVAVAAIAIRHSDKHAEPAPGALLPEPTGVRLVVTQTDGQLVLVDVDSGAVTDLAPSRRFRGVSKLVVLRDGVVVTVQTQTLLVAKGEMSFLPDGAALVGSPDGIRLVGVSYAENELHARAFIPGAVGDAAMTLPSQSEPVAMLPGGIVLQAASGGVYRFDLASGVSSKIADGLFVAAQGDRVVSMVCDDVTCHVGVAPLGGRPSHEAAIAPEGLNLGKYGRGGNALAPSRNLLAYGTMAQGRPTFSVLDLDTEAVVLSGVPYSGPAATPFVWSADGRWLFWVESGRVKAWSPDRGGAPIEFADAEAGSADLIAAGF